MQALRAIRERGNINAPIEDDSVASGGASSRDPALQDLNLFASRPAKRFKLYHHELAPVAEPAPVHPQYLVSRHILDSKSTAYRGYGDLETHEFTVRNYEDTLLQVMADSPFNPEQSILYYELEIKCELLVVAMSIERRYVGLDLIGGAARDTNAVARAASASQPSDPTLDIRADARYPLALKSRFLQEPLNSYEWDVHNEELFGDVEGPQHCASTSGNALHRIGLLLDQTNLTLTATRDGKIVGTTRVDSSVSILNRDIGLMATFSLAKHGYAKAIFGDNSKPNHGFKFDLAAYIERRQREVAADVNAQVGQQVPFNLFRDFFEYYGYEKAARACNSGQILRQSVPSRTLLRQAIMSGHARKVPELLRDHFDIKGSQELLTSVCELSAKELALQQVSANVVPDITEISRDYTYDAAVLLVAPNNDHERARAHKACVDTRVALLDNVMEEVTKATNEKFSSHAFSGPAPVLRDLVKSFNTNIAKRPMDDNGRAALLRGFLQREYPDVFPADGVP